MKISLRMGIAMLMVSLLAATAAWGQTTWIVDQGGGGPQPLPAFLQAQAGVGQLQQQVRQGTLLGRFEGLEVVRELDARACGQLQGLTIRQDGVSCG